MTNRSNDRSSSNNDGSVVVASQKLLFLFSLDIAGFLSYETRNDLSGEDRSLPDQELNVEWGRNSFFEF
jgi:hypothetical protein